MTTPSHRITAWLPLCLILLVLVTESHGYRTWACKDGKCVKETTTDLAKAVSIDECKLTCLEHGGLWPRPKAGSKIGKTLVRINASAIYFYHDPVPETLGKILSGAQDIFLQRVRAYAQASTGPAAPGNDKIYEVQLRIDIYDPDITYFTTHADESYTLKIAKHPTETILTVKIEANTFFGARHGLETVTQLIIYDNLHNYYKLADDVEIKDCPYFTHRGITLDTARSYISVPSILWTLDMMSMNKMNTFHWHITDSHSFPYVSTAYPQLSEHGAYSDEKVYTPRDIETIVDYGLTRGIRIVPEFDAPAHVGEGWEALGKDLVTCFGWEPWRSFCVEPPCGQFDPTNEKLYDIIGTLFQEYAQLFPSDLFHMGGDEVNLNCWMSTPRIVDWMKRNNYTVDHDGFHKLWLYFQNKAYDKLKAARSQRKFKPILWTSSLTELANVEKHLNPNEYIIQIWTERDHPTIKELLKKKYQLIFSNYDELYLDCGGPSWVGEPGVNWCSPYKGWQTLYNHSGIAIAMSTAGLTEAHAKKLVLGSEAALWTEQVDESTMFARLWPRTAALGERLWANPSDSWKDVQFRMNHHRERLSLFKPYVELLQPQWCHQHDGFCD